MARECGIDGGTIGAYGTNPAPGEDTANAAVWAIRPDGTVLARYRLTAGPGGPPIPYFDTEAIAQTRPGTS